MRDFKVINPKVNPLPQFKEKQLVNTAYVMKRKLLYLVIAAQKNEVFP